ncbi:MAG: hypothetical protein K2Q01_01795 [Rickettsiales bacterium]|nr:hypothetical protein [Rickettsiales bacterium]
MAAQKGIGEKAAKLAGNANIIIPSELAHVVASMADVPLDSATSLPNLLAGKNAVRGA